MPELLDEELRARLGRRYGDAIEGWLDGLPLLLAELRERWRLEGLAPIQRGSMSVVLRCRAGGADAVLKLGPDRARIADEAAALRRWRTPRVPAVLALDPDAGALLIEAVEPGTPLAETSRTPGLGELAALLSSLHEGTPDAAYGPLAGHVARLFDASRKLYELEPGLVDLVPPELYERSREQALRLAAEPATTVLLHGDLTPANVLEGGPERGLVAVDPSPCLGDPAFDAVDLVFWRPQDGETVAARARALATSIGADPERLLAWCAVFAGMAALELAEARRGTPQQIAALVALAQTV